MSKSDQQCWVIKNKDGFYVNAGFRALFSGRTTGFVGYIDKGKMQRDLDRLGGLEEGYYYEQVDLSKIPLGERVYT